MKKVLVVYASMSGNTAEVAEIVIEELINNEIEVDTCYIDVVGVTPQINTDKYSSIFLGTYTWDLGYAPQEISDFVEKNDLKGKIVHSFGTGETQFGDDLYCIASEKVAHYYNSPSPVLKIEQSPRGKQEKLVREWTQNIVKEGMI